MIESAPGKNWDMKPEYSQVFEVGRQTDLIVLEDGNPRTYKSQIQDATEKELVVSSPMHKGVGVYVPIGGEITISMFDDGARYMGSGTVLARELSPIDVLRMLRPERVRRVQLRAYFRLEIFITGCTLHVQPSSDPNVLEEIEVEIINISAGGARFRIPKEMPTSEVAPTVKYFLEFPLNFADPLRKRRDAASKDGEGEVPTPLEVFSVPIRIISVGEAGEGRKAFFIARGSFIGPGMQVEDRITRFVSQYQLALRRRRFI